MFRAIGLWALLAFAAAVPVEAARVALVIGNAKYESPGALLTNSVGDARAVAAMLRELDFDVIEATDLSAEETERVVNRFIRAIRPGDEAVFYYAGHGIEMSDGLQTSNYLLPVDVSLAWDKVQFRRRSLSASAMQERMESAGARVRILILDACRDNPFDGRSLGRGLGAMRPRGGLVAFAAEAGRTASDDGLFARELVAALGEPGLPASLLFEQVGEAVARASGGGQRPAYYSAGAGGFVFRTDRDDSAATVEAALGLDRAARRAVQVGLLAEGYSVGSPDGQFGPRSREAIRQWQVARGETQTGYLNEESATLLREASRDLLSDLTGNSPSSEAPVEVPDVPEVRTIANRETFRDCPHCPEMVMVPAGQFRMGCVSGRGCRANELPVHTVDVESFALGVHEVTYREYDLFVDVTGRDAPADDGGGRGNRPVMNVSWEDAVAYTAWLSSETGERYRLPSEAEWEYAVRAGTSTAYSWGNQVEDGRGQANCVACFSGGRIDEVRLFAANAWHLHDLHGNVAEWVEDCWHESYFGAPNDGSAWFSAGDCSWRVMRGGSAYSSSHYLRSAGRNRMQAGASLEGLGFRVASVFNRDDGDRGTQFFGIEAFRYGNVDPLLWVVSEESVALEYLGYGPYVEVLSGDQVVFRKDGDGIGTTLLRAGIVQNEPGRMYLVSQWTKGAHSQFVEVHEIELEGSREARDVFYFSAAYSVRIDVDEARLIASDGQGNSATFEFE